MKKLISILMIAATVTTTFAQFSGPEEAKPVVENADADKLLTYDKSWVSAWLLFKRYDQNPIAADAKYRYETVVVVGIVEDIGRDILGNPYVVLKGSQEEFSLGGVQCTFDVADEAEIAEISEGQKVAIFGEVKGLILFNVQIDGCQFTTMPIKVKKAIAVSKG